MKLEEREKAIFEILEKIAEYDVILIGGYAINAYTLPRFSVDCDLVLEKKNKELENTLIKNGFEQTESGKTDAPYSGEFARFENELASIDLLIKNVVDRRTGIAFSHNFISNNSKIRETVGRATAKRIRIRIANPEVLFVMKFVACRRQDIRDIFMLSSTTLDKDFITNIIKEKYKNSTENTGKITEIVESRNFRDALQGVYGFLQEKTFQKTKNNFINILRRLKV